MSNITSSSFTLLSPAPYLPLSERSGNLPFTLTNDYMFKAVFQTDNSALRALLCSLLDLTDEDILTIVITNALVLGATIESKDTILDLHLILNSRQIIDIEMQLRNEKNWPERSLYYLCSSFNNLETGENYLNVSPAHHIGILGFGLPNLQKQFYSHYYMSNETTHEIFYDKFRLSILNLTQTELATEHDRRAGLTRWAAAFKATTWEEYQMLAEEDSIFEKVSDALYLLSQHPEVARQCRRMQEAEAVRKYREEMDRQQAAELERKAAEIEQKSAEIKQKSAEIEQKDTELKQKDTEIEQKAAVIEQKDTELKQKDTEIEQQANEIERLKAEIKRLTAEGLSQ